MNIPNFLFSWLDYTNYLQLQKLLTILHPPFLLACFVFILIHFIAEPTRWLIYQKSSGLIPKYLLTYQIFLATSFASYFLPFKLGLPLRLGLLKYKLPFDLNQISSYLLLDGAIYYALWMLSAVFALFFSITLPTKLKININILLVTCTILFFFIWLSVFLLQDRKINKEVEPCKRRVILTKFQEILRTFKNFTPVALLLTICVVITDIISHVLRHWALLASMGFSIPLEQIFITTSIGIFAGLTSMMPMGLGGYDLTIVLLLTHFSVPPEIAVCVPVLNRILTLIFSAIFGSWGGLSLGLNIAKIKYFANQMIRK